MNLQLEEDLLSNLHAAQLFQVGLMPALRSTQPEPLPFPHFILWKPNQIVGGDFFWHHTDRKRTFLAVGDVMGHGVFGAMLTIIFMQQLRHLVQLSGIWTTDKLAAEIDHYLSHLFRGAFDHPITIDSFLGVLDTGRRRLSYTNFKGKAYLVRNKQQIEKLHSYPFSFGENLGTAAEEHEIALQPADRLYLLSDGLANQLSSRDNKPLGSKAIAELLLELQPTPIHEQKDLLESKLSTLRGGHPQSDDIVVVGIEIE
ncbi:MAG: serine/threonine-protein phosphatase [Bacteroidia bacterium]|nr:serine/threonine-protein phosphatase [Bacteroidia bacterium]MDW8057856.1 SpoIIE family protein phosphatase [Bacteroidia bacterium]